MTSESSERPIEILLVEDEPADARLTQEILKGSSHQTNITVAEDGEVAMARLRREGEYESSPRPDLILLDLKLPGMDGGEVLGQIAGDPNLVDIPVIILTGTEAEQSLLHSHNIPPSRYFRKPIELESFHRAIGQLGMFSRQPIRLSATEAQTGPEAKEPADQKKRWWWPFG